ncbi:MAG: succinate dehydrogenase, cytochrome b556 subunit [Euryarchaeota archaeon]|nr:succinate dehydrogenase, cytochrome b556 subunit [Euryarchaeota archaeon]
MYKKAEPSEIGMWSWLLERITGVLLVFYLFVHLWSRHFAGKLAVIDATAARLQTPFFNLTLLALVLFHGLNGIRVVLIDFGLSARAQRFVFWALMVLGFVMFLAGASILK